MMLRKMGTNYDLSPIGLDVAVREFVDAFGGWPKALICAADAEQGSSREHARDLGLELHCVPQAIVLKQDAWAIVGDDGNTIWSPGA